MEQLTDLKAILHSNFRLSFVSPFFDFFVNISNKISESSALELKKCRHTNFRLYIYILSHTR